MAKSELSCQELVELITSCLDEALSDDELARFQVHIAACDGCETYLDQIRQTSVALGQLTEGAIDPDARNALIRAFRNWRGPDGSAAAP
jgi:anti-sigma factor RsiW